MEQNLNITQGFSLTSKIDGSTMSKTHRFLYVFWITPSVWWSKLLILRKVFHYFQAHVSKNLRKYNDSLTKCHKTTRNLMFFHGFRAQEARGCLGTTRRPKNLQIDHFFNKKVKRNSASFWTGRFRSEVRRPGPGIASNAFEPPGGQKVSKSIIFWIETWRNLAPFRTGRFLCIS